jgi:hypothetical protein
MKEGMYHFDVWLPRQLVVHAFHFHLGKLKTKNAFGDIVSCAANSSFTFPNNSGLLDIPSIAFAGTGLVAVSIPSYANVTQDKAFWRYRSLSEAEIPADLKITTIAEYAFSSAGKLEFLRLPKLLEKFEGTAILDIKRLELDPENTAFWLSPDGKVLFDSTRQKMIFVLLQDTLTVPNTVKVMGQFCCYQVRKCDVIFEPPC